MHHEVLKELLEEQVTRVVNCHNHRVVKRKMSKFTIRFPVAGGARKTDGTIAVLIVM